MIEITNLTKSFGNLQVLKAINITINDGEIYGLVGKSGEGKSTLLRCINGLITYDEGSLKVDGTEISSLNKSQTRVLRKDMGMIFQHFSLLERRTVYENVALPLKCWGYDKKYIDKRVKELLELVDISNKINDKPRVLSGGQKQRVAIARALAMEPKILMCDEATSALDPNTTKSILNLLREINRKLGITVVVVTHQMSVVKDLCDKISILEHGKIAVTGKVEDVFMDQPPVLKRLLGKEELLLLETGSNIRLIMSAAQTQEPVLSKLAKECDVDFSIIGGKMERYKEHMIGSLVINIKAEKQEEVIDFFKRNGYKWEIIDADDIAIEAYTEEGNE